MGLLPWYPETPILSMCYDSSGSWLLCTTTHSRIILVPAACILDPDTKIDAIWNTADTTEFKLSKKRGVATCVSWWQTLEAEHFAVIGTKLGYVVLVDLRTGKQVTEVDVSEHVTGIELVRDNSQSFTYALITTKSNSQWKLLLEQKVEPPLPEPTTDGAPQLDKGTFSMGEIISITNITDDTAEDFVPLKFYQFSSSSMLSAQYARGRHCVAAQDMKTNLYQVYDSNTNYSPLYIYRLPNWADVNTVLADKLLFLTARQGEATATSTPREASLEASMTSKQDEATLTILAAQMAEVSNQYFQSFNQDSILHQFHLQPGEEILSIYKKTFPFYWHERKEAGSVGSHGNKDGGALLAPPSHTVLDGCMLLTTHAVYECRPRVSPEKLFLEMSLSSSTEAEKLGIMLALDVGSLFQKVAEYKLSSGCVGAACKLLQMAKCPPSQRVSMLIKYGRISEVLAYIRQIFQSRRLELGQSETSRLADTLLQCYLHQLLQRGAEAGEVMGDFRKFLLENNCYDSDMALDLLAQYGIVDLLLQVARAKNKLPRALRLLLQQGSLTLTPDLVQVVSKAALSSGLCRDSLGLLLQNLSIEDLLPLFNQHPQLLVDLLHEVENALPMLDVVTLQAVAGLLDISQSVLKPLWLRSFVFDSQAQEKPGEIVDITELVDVFVHAVITLNHHRVAPLDLDYLTQPSDTKDDVPEITEAVTEESPGPQQCLGCKPTLLACGPSHGMVVREGELYAWGRTAHGRLGCDATPPGRNIQYDPVRVSALCAPGLKVLSVACGTEHTLAITNMGLYGWGNSRYGQVGCGDRGVHSTPTLLASSATGHYVAAQCGQYHSVALSSDCRVYTWGWGVHGQLGQGHPEDVLQPTSVAALESVQVVDVAAGYAHTVFCTQQGEVYTCGNDLFGQLALRRREKVSLPTRVVDLVEPVRTVATQHFHNLALTESGNLYTWGIHPNLVRYAMNQARKAKSAGQGSAGRGVTEKVDQSALTLVDTHLINSKIVQICCGSLFSALLTKDGEVFTWGKNFAGQLGTGIRSDERNPVMVVKINDVRVVDLATGPSHMVAMDTEGSVWGWGRSDEGQLCMKPDKLPEQPRRTLQFPVKAQPFSVVITPLRLMRAAKTRLELSSQTWWLEEVQDRGHHLMLGDLRGESASPYPPSCLLQVIKCLPEMFNPTAMLRRCLDIGAWQCATLIARHLRLYGKALDYQLQALSQHQESLDEFLAWAVQVVQFYLCQILEEGATDHRHATCEIALEKILVFWLDHDAPLCDLEGLLQDNITELAYPLLLLQTRCSSHHSEDHPRQRTITKCATVLQRLSTNFHLTLTSTLLAQITSGRIPEQQLWSKLMGPEGNAAFTNLGLKPTEKLVAAERLWQGIVANLKKGAEAWVAVSVSSQTLLNLCENNQKEETSSDQRKQPAAVLFTCGHQFAKRTFMESVVPELEETLSHKPQSLSHTAALLKKYYTREGYYPMACPKCVLAAVKQL